MQLDVQNTEAAQVTAACRQFNTSTLRAVPSDSHLELKQAVVVHTLRTCPIFADLDSSRLSVIASMTVPKSLAREQYLFCEGNPVQGFFVVQSGAVKLRKLNGRGHEQLIHVCRANESFAEDMLLSDSGYSADACATEVSQVLMIQKCSFLRLIRTDADLSMRLLWSVEQKVHQLIGLLDDLTLKDAKTRLANWLIHQCPKPESACPQQIQLSMTKRLLASELGVTSETLSRTLNKFRQQRLLSVKGRIITILSPARFSKWLRGEDRARWSLEPATTRFNSLPSNGFAAAH